MLLRKRQDLEDYSRRVFSLTLKLVLETPDSYIGMPGFKSQLLANAHSKRESVIIQFPGPLQPTWDS